MLNLNLNPINFNSIPKHKPKVAFAGRQNFDAPQDVVEISGTETKAKVYTSNIDYPAYNQIKTICSHPAFADVPVRIMPDVHPSVNTVVGFTAPISASGAVIPNIIGSDIGCGMLCCEIDTNGEEIDFEKLNDVIKTYLTQKRIEIPTAKATYQSKIERQMADLYKHKFKTSEEPVLASLGTLGGGNHFIEIDKSKDGKTYLVVHTGSRKFGIDVNNYHQQIAKEQNPYKISDLSYLTGAEAQEYLEDLKLATKFSQYNRRVIADEIIQQMGWNEIDSFESIHNYIADDGIIRKGSISANDGERVIIPLNMRDGAILGTGRGNSDWNCSAPHGAGRQFKRGDMAELIDLKEFKNAMEGIYSNCISETTIDEAPQAYKESDEIIGAIDDTVVQEEHIRPIFNYKD